MIADGTVFIGCSELTGRYWTGAASLFKSVGEAKNVNETNKDLWLTSGTADGCFMENSDKVNLIKYIFVFIVLIY